MTRINEKFPIFGSLNLSYRLNKESDDFLKGLIVLKSDTNIEAGTDRGFYAVSFSDDEIEDNTDDNIKKMLDLQKLADSGERLSDRIQHFDEYQIYKVVTPQGDNPNKELLNLNSNMIPINENCLEGSYVLLELDNKLYGPYSVQVRQYDGLQYIRPDSVNKKYILNYYDISNAGCHRVTFEIQQYLQDPVPVEYAYIENPNGYKQDDVISDSLLLAKIQDDINIDLQEFEQLYSTSPFLNDSSISEKFRAARIERVKSIITNVDQFDKEKQEILASLVGKIGVNILNQVNDEVIKSTNPYQLLLNTKNDLSKKVDHLLSDNDELHKRISVLEQQITEEQNTSLVTTGTASSEEYDKLKQENEKLREQLSEFSEKETIKENIAKLKEEIKQYEQTSDYLVNRIQEKQKDYAALQEQVKETITKTVNEATLVENAFDPYIANVLVEAAGKMRKKTEMDHYKIIVESTNGVSCDPLSKDELVGYLVKGVQSFRKYGHNDIVNMYICLAQNFLTIFSGEPGVGKTSICNILAASLGLDKFGEKIFSDGEKILINRYIPVSVERGWTTKRDLIGYYNPLTQNYDRSNSKIYDALMLLNEERDNSRFPFVILLDEANLSPIEYYWADFMRCADRDDSDIFVNIGTDSDVYIPETLHFLATINNDQTTEELSPRLIDRAWILKLPDTAAEKTKETFSDVFSKLVLWDDLKNAFVVASNREIALKKSFEEICDLFKKYHMPVSPRVKQSMERYICVAQEIMEDEDDVSKKQKALDFAVVQKLLPKINGYFKNFERLFDELDIKCDDNHLKMTKDALRNMREYAEQNIGYCKYIL